MLHDVRIGAAVEGQRGALDAVVLHRRAFVLAEVFGPGADEEGLAIERGIVEIDKDRAAEGAVAQPGLAEMKHGGAEGGGFGGVDVIFDGDEDRSIVRRRLIGQRVIAPVAGRRKVQTAAVSFIVVPTFEITLPTQRARKSGRRSGDQADIAGEISEEE